MTPLIAALILTQGTTPSDVILPFTSPKGLIVVETIGNDDKPLRMLVDTGAQRTFVDVEVAKRLGLEVGDEIKARGSGGMVTARFSKGLRLKGLNDEPIEAVALSLKGIVDAIGAPIDAILGQDVLGKRVMEVDWATAKLTFSSQAPMVSAYDTVISLHLRGGRPYAPATIVTPSGREADADLLLDTGSDTIVEIAQPYADSIGLRTRPDPNGRSLLGVGGAVPLRVPELQEARLGRESVQPADVRVFYRPVDSAGDGDGRVGSGFLVRYKTLIDGPRLKLVLKPVRKD